MNEATNRTKRVYRLKDGRIVAGVCTGLGGYVGIDATLIRLGFALFTAFGGLGVLLYLCAWIVLPDETDGVSIAQSFVGERRP
jgi:phage shock protein C